MKELRNALWDLIALQKNISKHIAAAYPVAAALFSGATHIDKAAKAYLTPYKDAFEIIGFEVEKNYYPHANLPEFQAINESVTPLQAAELIMKIFSQESFFIIHCSCLLAFSQKAHMGKLVTMKEETYFKSKSNQNKSISFMMLMSDLETVNCMPTYKLVIDCLKNVVIKIETQIPQAQGLNKLKEVIEFLNKLSKKSMQYLDSLIDFQNFDNDQKQLPSDIHVKQIELVARQEKLNLIARAKLTDKGQEKARKQKRRIQVLMSEIVLLEKKLNASQASVVAAFKQSLIELYALQSEAKKLADEIQPQTNLNMLETKSSTLAWKRAIDKNRPDLLEKMFALGLNPIMVEAYISPSNIHATINPNKVSIEVRKCVALACQTLNQPLKQQTHDEKDFVLSATSKEIKQTNTAASAAAAPLPKELKLIEPIALVVSDPETVITPHLSTKLDVPLPKQVPTLFAFPKKFGPEKETFSSGTIKSLRDRKAVGNVKGFFENLPIAQPKQPPIAGIKKQTSTPTTGAKKAATQAPSSNMLPTPGF